MLTFNVDDVLRKIMPAVWAVLMFVVLSLNFWAGWKVDGLLIGMAFVCVALLGAFAAANVRQAPVAMKPVLAAVIAFQLLLGQWAGWQAVGLNLAQNTAVLDTQADLHHANRDELKRAQERRTALGTPRPVDAIAAERELECKRTSRTYKDGKGPRCTALMSEEAAAQEAAGLDRRIPELKAQLEAGGQLTDGNAPFSVAMKVSSVVASLVTGKPVTVGREDVLFGFKIFFVFLLEFLATCGPMLLQMLERETPQPVAGPRKRITYQPLSSGASDADTHPRQGMPRAPDEDEDAVADKASSGYLTSGSGGERPAQAETEPGRSNSPALSLPAVPAHATGHNTVQGAPINVNLYTSPGASEARYASAPRAQEAPAKDPARLADKVSDRNVAKLRDVLPAAPADVPPADRAGMREVCDGIVAFRAACLIHMPGGLVPMDDVYAAYQAYRSGRAATRTTFDGLFEDVTKIPVSAMAGVSYANGVGLRAIARASA